MKNRYGAFLMLLFAEGTVFCAAMSDEDFEKYLVDAAKESQESAAASNAVRKKASDCGQILEHLTDKGQYDPLYNLPGKDSRMNVSCGGIALMAANELEHVGLENLKKIDLDKVLREGNDFYRRFLNDNKNRKKGLLTLEEVVQQTAKENLFLKNESFRDERVRTEGLVYLFSYLEQQKNNAYVLLTFSNQTVMIGFLVQDKYFVFFDSHRKDNLAIPEGGETPGAGYHVFSDKQSLLCYLANYPNLSEEIDMEFFVPKGKEYAAVGGSAESSSAAALRDAESDDKLIAKILQEDADSALAKELEEGSFLGQNRVVQKALLAPLKGFKFKKP